jgi:hypothetical protein
MYQKRDTWGVAMNQLGSGASRIIMPIYYDALDPYGCQASGTFGHMILLVAKDGDRIRASDPLCNVTKWYPESAIKKAATVFAGRDILWYGITRVVPKTA